VDRAGSVARALRDLKEVPEGPAVSDDSRDPSRHGVRASARAVGMGEIVGAGKPLGDDHAPSVDD
jgi:hypothetical protein